MLQALNVFFFVFHTLVIIFNLAGWLIPRLRRLHLLVIGITAFSWLILGWWYGWGYCFCTDWHWQVRQALGLPVPYSSYVHFLFESIFPWNPNPAWVDAATLAGFLFGLAGSMWVNLRNPRKPAG